MKATRIVEALLFASDAPLRAEEICRADEELDEDVVEEAIRTLRDEYGAGERAFDVVEVAGGFQLLTRPEFAPYLERFDTVPRSARLSAAALETLGIICYRQPIGRVEIEFIRGVSSAGVIRTLVDRDLVEVAGRGEGLGRPLLYGTTQRFLEHFGFDSLEDLPRPDELPVILRERTPLGLDEPDDEDEDASPETTGSEDEASAEAEAEAEAEAAAAAGAADAAADADADNAEAAADADAVADAAAGAPEAAAGAEADAEAAADVDADAEAVADAAADHADAVPVSAPQESDEARGRDG